MGKQLGSLDATADGGEVQAIASCRLVVGSARWAFADNNQSAVECHWRKSVAENPGYFNGKVYVLANGGIAGETLNGELAPVEFKSYLYWRDQGYPETGVRDVFGSALIRSSEGHVLLGRQSAGNLNAGLTYLPGGFIDARDVGADGCIDIEANVRREVAEETGLGAGELERVPGYRVTRAGPHVSLAVELRSALPAETLRARMLDFIAAEAAPELADIVVVKSGSDIDPRRMPLYAAVLMRHLLT